MPANTAYNATFVRDFGANQTADVNIVPFTGQFWGNLSPYMTLGLSTNLPQVDVTMTPTMVTKAQRASYVATQTLPLGGSLVTLTATFANIAFTSNSVHTSDFFTVSGSPPTTTVRVSGYYTLALDTCTSSTAENTGTTLQYKVVTRILVDGTPVTGTTVEVIEYNQEYAITSVIQHRVFIAAGQVVSTQIRTEDPANPGVVNLVGGLSTASLDITGNF